MRGNRWRSSLAREKRPVSPEKGVAHNTKSEVSCQNVLAEPLVEKKEEEMTDLGDKSELILYRGILKYSMRGRRSLVRPRGLVGTP